MKKLLFISILFITSNSFAQLQWNVRAIQKTAGCYTLLLNATIDKGWYVYAADAAVVCMQDSFAIAGDSVIIQDKIFKEKKKVFVHYLQATRTMTIKGSIPSSVAVTLKGFAANDSSFIPIEETKQISLPGGINNDSQIKLANIDLSKPLADCGEQRTSKNVFSIFLLGLAGGLISLLTPCVFPMIPLTVSYFMKQQKRSHGIYYGASIFSVYLLASVPFHIVGSLNPQMFNSIATNVWVNLAFFVIFVLFALSFFGLFEIALPNRMTNASSSKGGIFFMALTLVIVSFSCTGPVLGSLLAGSANAGAWALTAGMAGFGLALGLPFGLFAIFPQWLKKVPKSGSWLDTVKKMLAFIELAFAFKFLSNADLVGHWGILKRESFIVVWLILTFALSIYLLFREQLAFQLVAVFFLLFTGYIAMDFTGYDLPLLSGFPPPRSYSFFQKQNRLQPQAINDFDKAVALAKQQHKPILVDFTGWACVNCRKMEENVWVQPQIASAINDRFILVSLYVDDRKKLQQSVFYKDEELQTEGDKWALFEGENFGQVSQPLYVMLTPDGRLINHPMGYTPSIKAYNDWLECGLDTYHKNNN